MSKQLIITHHAPDLDAITSTWILKRFDARKYADAKIDFVNPGSKITIDRAEELGFELQNVVHVDTGLGRFDHHQPEQASQRICAASLVYDYVCLRNNDLEDDQALQIISEFATEVDHFEEINWHDAGSYRYNFMIHEIIHGIEFTDRHDDDSQMQFGMKCLDAVYATLVQQVKAKEIISEKGQEFLLGNKKCLALETRNDATLKIAQKQGFELVVRKDPKQGNIRIKVRPDSDLVLKELYQAIILKDPKGTWFYHGSGKMLINGSRKHKNQEPSKLSLEEVLNIIKETLS